MALDLNSLTASILQAMEGALGGHWSDVAPFAQTQAQSLAATALQIQEGQANGSIDSGTASLLLQVQADESKATLAAVETVGESAAQDAVNAAIGVLKDAINKAAGISFL